MKKNFFLALSLFFLTIFIFSCKKNENNEPAPTVLAKWKLNKIAYREDSLGIPLPTESDTLDLVNTNSYIDFRADNKAYFYYFDQYEPGYVIDTASYIVNANNTTLTFLFGGTDQTQFQITELTNNSLKFVANVTENPTYYTYHEAYELSK